MALAMVACDEKYRGAADDPDAAANLPADASDVFDAGPGPDAQASELTCLGAELPTSAPNNVSIDGTVFLLDELEEVPDNSVLVAARRADNDVELDSDTSAGGGAFALTAMTGMVPIEVYFHASGGGNLTSRLYPAVPVAGDMAATRVVVWDTQARDDVTLAAGVTQSGTAGLLVVGLVDCAGAPIADATVSLAPAGGDLVYAGNDGLPDPGRTATGLQGLAYVFNVPPGDVTVDADVGGQSLREHTVEAVADEITATTVQP